MPVDGRDFQHTGEIPLLLQVCNCNCVLLGSEDLNCATASSERLVLLACFIAHNPSFLSFPTPSTCSLLYTLLQETSICFKQTKKINNKQNTTKKKPSQKEGQAVKGVPQQGVALLLTRYQQMGCHSTPCHTALRV